MHSRLYRNLQLLITSYLSGSIERINFFREFHLSEGLQEFLGLENLNRWRSVSKKYKLTVYSV